MNNCTAISEERTLMNIYHQLESKCEAFKELEHLTERINDKFDRTEGDPKCELEQELKSPEHPDLIEMFQKLANRLESSINVIGSNTEKTLKRID